MSFFDQVTQFAVTSRDAFASGVAAPIAAGATGKTADTVIPADVMAFSGCMDAQTSADVSDVSSFGVARPVSAADRAGGACTNALLSVVKTNPSLTYGSLLVKMQSMLKAKNFKQVPQLSSSRRVDLHSQQFNLHHPRGSGRTRALVIGINYTGSDAALSGCVNDVKQVCTYLDGIRFAADASSRRVLTDDPSFTNGAPTAHNILEGMKWLVQGAAAGDALFFHFSGHGGQIADDDGDEADGFDETLVPLDYLSAGQIRDDLIFKMLVAPLPAGVQLVALFDCCHSGTILDLPFSLLADGAACAKLSTSDGTQPSSLPENSGFNLFAAIKLIAEVAQGMVSTVTDTMQEVQRSLGAKSRGLNLGRFF